MLVSALTGGFAAVADQRAEVDSAAGAITLPAPDLGPAEAYAAPIRFTDIKPAEDALPGVVKKW